MVGYRACTCGQLVLESTWFLTSGVCQACWEAGATRNIRVTEVMNAGRRVNLPDPGSRSGTGRRGKSRGKGNNVRTIRKAKEAALRRLGRIYPELYEMFYAEERLRRGLEPVPSRQPLQGAETHELDVLYAALFEQETG